MTMELLARLKQIVGEVLGAEASPLLISRLHTLLEQGGDSPAGIKDACDKVERVVTLFVGAAQAKVVAHKLRNARVSA